MGHTIGDDALAASYTELSDITRYYTVYNTKKKFSIELLQLSELPHGLPYLQNLLFTQGNQAINLNQAHRKAQLD